MSEILTPKEVQKKYDWSYMTIGIEDVKSA